jgi:hypothetical protein
MKNAIVTTVLCFLLALSLSSAADVAELRRLRALEWGNGHHGGDNGRDHPGMYQSNPVPAPAPVEGEEVTAVESESAAEDAVPAPLETEVKATQAAQSPYSCGGSFSKGVVIALGAVMGAILLAVGMAMVFCPTNAPKSTQTTAKSVPVPTKDQDALGEMTAASDSASHDDV